MESRLRIKKPIVPRYAIIPLLVCLTINNIVYCGAELIAGGWKHYDLTLPVDRSISVIPEFIWIYLGCYLFWFVNYIMIVRQGKEHCFRFATADIMSRLICGMFYLLLPTTNVRPKLAGGGISTMLLQIIYEIDQPSRLFPSIHCLISWFCFIGIRNQKNIPKAYQIFSCLFAILVCVSTQLTKQHYMVDVFGAVLLAELTYRIAFRTEIYQFTERFFEWLYKKCFHSKGKGCEKESEL